MGHSEAPVNKHTLALDAAGGHPTHETTREISLREWQRWQHTRRRQHAFGHETRRHNADQHADKGSEV